jgi:hypothetical protein
VSAAAEHEEVKSDDEAEQSEEEVQRSESSADEEDVEEKSQPSVKIVDSEEVLKAESGEDDDWLQGMSFDPAGKRPPVCFKFADTGTCEYGTKCVYSHNIEDVKAYKAAKLLGPARMGNISNQHAQRSASDRKDSSSQHKGPTGGRKTFDRPTSILRRSQDARNNT